MTITPISPSFCGSKEMKKAQKNIKKVTKMASRKYDTKSSIIGTNGAFIVEGYRKEGLTLKSGFPPAYVVKYSPDKGLETKISFDCFHALYEVYTQKSKEEVPKKEKYLMDTKLRKDFDSKNPAPSLEEILEKNYVNPSVKYDLALEIPNEELEIQDAIGKIYPTLNDIIE